MKRLINGYDIIGSREKAVAIVEIPEDLKSKEKEIAEQIMNRHKNVKSVLKKVSERKGVFRTRDYELLLGDPDTEVIHKETGCRFRLDPRKVYFSGREGTERLRMAKIVKPKETILVMFSGIGPFPIVIAKKQPKIKKIISIEINPIAFEYMKENIKMNKLEDKIIPVLGDVRKKCRDWFGKCDRVVMPLPHEAHKFLDIAFKCLKPVGGFIHLYLIEGEDEVKERVKEIIKDLKKKTKKEIDFETREVLPYAPGVKKYCVDIEIS